MLGAYCTALVLQHPVAGEPPIAVAELITTEHDCDAISFLAKFLRDAHSLRHKQVTAYRGS